MKTPHLKGLLFCAAIITASAAMADYVSTVNSLGPVAYYRLSETNPVPANLFSNLGTAGAVGNGYYLNDTNGPATPAHPITPGPLATGSGVAAAINLSGEDSYMLVPLDPANNPQGAFTAEAWIEPTVVPTTLSTVMAYGHLENPATGPNRSGWLLYQDSGSAGPGAFNFRMYNHVGINRSLTLIGYNPASYTPGNWFHVAVAYDGTNGYLYVNGALIASGASPGYVPNVDGNFSIGIRNDLAYINEGANIAEVALYTNKLDDATIAAHYQNGINPTPPQAYNALVGASNPLLYYRFNEPAYTPPVTLPTTANTGSYGSAYDGTIVDDLLMGQPGVPFPGFPAGNTAPRFNGFSGSVSIANPPLNTANVTFTAWVKRLGPPAGEGLQGGTWGQNGWAGIVFQRGVANATGFGFGSANDLRYTWENDANTYNWVPSPQMVVPDAVWNFVAASFSPSQTILCLNGVFATNVYANLVHDFSVDDIWIGQDPGEDRFVKGWIDEVAIFDKTLTPNQLLQMYSASGIPPQITQQPQPPTNTLYEGMTFSMSVAAFGPPPLTYQWTKNTGNINGQTNTTLSFTNLHTGDSGSYAVVVACSSGSVTSSIVPLTVLGGPPILVTAPASVSRYPGGGVSFSVSAVGSTPITYQWFKGTNAIPGATNTTFSITLLQSSDAASYSVVASNPYGQTPSSPATLTLLPVTPNAVAAIVARNPIAYWRLNETNGSTAFDSMGGFDGTYNPVTTLNNQAGPRPPSFAGFEASNTAYDFNGNTSDISCAPFNETMTEATILLMMNPVALVPNGNFGLVVCRGSGNEVAGMNVYSGSGDLGFIWNNSTTWDSTLLPTPNQWNFAALVIETNQATMYLDAGSGLQNNVLSVTNGPEDFFAPVHIGTDPTGNDIFGGLIDEVAFFDHMLTPAEIQAIHDAIYKNTYSPIPPTIVVQPVSQNLFVGDSFTLAAEATGSQPLTYQWTKNGVNITNAIRGSISFPSASAADSGTYQLVVSQGATVVKSTPAIIQVLPLPSYVLLTNNLVLHLKFDGNFLDSSPSGDNPTVNGAPTFVPDGQLGQAARLSNLNYLVVPDPNSQLLFDINQDFTVAFWVRFTNGFNDLPIIGNSINSTYQLGWVFTEDDEKIEYSLVSTANSGTYVADPVSGSPIIQDGAWHNVVGVVDRTNAMASVYVDGAIAGTWSIAGLDTLITGSEVTIAQDPTGSYGVAGTFDLDDLGIWLQVLDPISARSIYYAGKAGHSFDTPAPAIVTVTLGKPQVVGGNVTVSWTPASGTLYASPAVAGTNVNWVSVGSGGSVTLPVTATPRFFKVAQ